MVLGEMDVVRVKPAQLTAFHVNSPPTRQPEDAAFANKPWLLKDAKNEGTRISTVIVTEIARGCMDIPCNA